MARKYFTAEQIVKKLREAEVLLAQGKSIQEATRQIEVSDNNPIRFRNIWIRPFNPYDGQ